MHHQTTRKPPLISQSTRNPVTHIGIVNIPGKHFNDRGVHSVAAPLREGKNQNEKTFGIPAEEIFQAIYRSPLTLQSPVLLYCRKVSPPAKTFPFPCGAAGPRRRCWSSWVWWTPPGFWTATTSPRRSTSPAFTALSISEVGGQTSLFFFNWLYSLGNRIE